MPALLTFGDSNTNGVLPIRFEGDRNRLGPDQRWPGVCLGALGPAWSLAEEGLPGRTTSRPDPEMGPHMDGRVGLMIALQTHWPIDVMTLMLGTNDLKAHFAASAAEIAEDVGVLLDLCLDEEMQDRHGGFEILLICPPPILETGELAEKFLGGAVKSLDLAARYRAQAEAREVAFLDAGKVIESSPVDGIHYDAETHQTLGLAVAEAVRALA